MRLVGTSIDCYKYLEPLYYDYRKMKRQNKDGGKFLLWNAKNLFYRDEKQF